VTQALHHTNARQLAPNGWEVVKPLPDSSPWHRWKRDRACHKALGHCYHPEDLIGWFCCECGAETDGMPPQDCVRCR
jgi:hypothetical protein